MLQMKKMLLVLFMTFAVVPTFAQATLKHEFRDLTHSNYSYYHSGFQHSIREYVYEILPEVSYVIPECRENNILTGFSAYDANFELVKEIPFLLEGIWNSSGTIFCAIVGKHLFNTDDVYKLCQLFCNFGFYFLGDFFRWKLFKIYSGTAARRDYSWSIYRTSRIYRRGNRNEPRPFVT